MRSRKFLAALLAIGYLAAVQCQLICAASLPLVEKSAPAASSCHEHESGPQDDRSDSSCCASHLHSGQALLPAQATAVAPNVFWSYVLIQPSAAVLSSRPLALTQNHDPPRSVFDVLVATSRGPRPPPFGA